MLIAVVLVVIYVIQAINYLNKVNNGMGLHDFVTTTGPNPVNVAFVIVAVPFRRVSLSRRHRD